MVIGLGGCGDSPNQPGPSTAEPADLVPVTLRVHAWAGYAEQFSDEFQQKMRQQGYDVTIELQTATASKVLNKQSPLIKPTLLVQLMI